MLKFSDLLPIIYMRSCIMDPNNVTALQAETAKITK